MIDELVEFAYEVHCRRGQRPELSKTNSAHSPLELGGVFMRDGRHARPS
jgi:hypothetical protein